MPDIAEAPVYQGWEIVGKIGSGSFGAVYEIQRQVFGVIEKAALKQIRIPGDDSAVKELRSMGLSDEKIREQFREDLDQIMSEYRLMAELKGNSNIVHCEDLSCVPAADGLGWVMYIRMELLSPLMKSMSAVESEEQITRLGIDIASALVDCEARHIIHRDIKPQNIFLSRDGDFKLGDFGVAKSLEKTSGGTMIGTYNYMAPEVYLNKPYGHSADVYSLGLVLYWLLNEHRHPFYPLPPQTPSAQDVEEARALRFQGKAIPAPAHGSQALQRIVMKACSYDPAARYHSAGEMLRDLKALLSGPADLNPDESASDFRPEVQEPAPRRSPLRWIVPVMVVVLGAIGAILLMTRQRERTPEPVSIEEQAQVSAAETEEPQLPEVAEGNISWSLDSDGVLRISGSGDMEDYAAPEDAPWFAEGSSIESLVIDEGITSIGDYAFYNAYAMNSVSLPQSLTEIGAYSFAYCSGLRAVDFPDGLNVIGDHAFDNCQRLQSFSFPAGLRSLGAYSFAACNPRSVVLPEGLDSVCDGLFFECKYMEELSIPSGVKSIGEKAFSGCGNLKRVDLPEGVTEIRASAFASSVIDTFVFPSTLETIGKDAFSSCFISHFIFRGSREQWEALEGTPPVYNDEDIRFEP